MQNRLLLLPDAYTVLTLQSGLFSDYFYVHFVTMHNVIIGKSHGGHLEFMQMRALLFLYS